jgi:putative acyl-CoA dehydrogenase
VADAYLDSRVAGDRGQAFGTLPRGADVDALLDRLPETERSGARPFDPDTTTPERA